MCRQQHQNLSVMNQFKEKLYEEFEDNSYKLLGVPSDRVREVLAERGEDIDVLSQHSATGLTVQMFRPCM